MKLSRLAEIINREFNGFGLPENHVEATATEEAINIRIGPRDVRIDFKGTVTDAGTVAVGMTNEDVMRMLDMEETNLREALEREETENNDRN